MLTRAPDVDGMSEGQTEARPRISDDDPVLRAIRNAPIVDEEETEEEREAVRECQESGVWFDAATITAEIADRARREG